MVNDGCSGYLYQKNDSYILFDKESMCFYTVPVEIGTQIEALDNEEKDSLLERTLNSKRKAFTCLQDEDKDNNQENKCSRLILVITQFCNFACKYCYADEGTYGNDCNKLMDFHTAKNAIDAMLKIFPKGIKMIQFFGGEPLLNYKIIKQVCDYCKVLYEDNKISELPLFSVVTNGSIISDEIIDVFNEYNINITISLDGSKDINDKQRVFNKSERSVFDKVVETIEVLNKCRRFTLSVEITISQLYLNLSEIERQEFLDFLVKCRIDAIHIVPVIVDSKSEFYIKDDSLLQETVDMITDFSLNTLMTANPFYVVKAADFLSAIMSRHHKSNFCNAGINNFAIDTQGDIYGCFMLIDPDRKMCMGNVNEEKIDLNRFSSYRDMFKKVTYDSCEECSLCVIKGFCSNCVAASYISNGKLNKPIKHSCIAQKAIFERIGYHIAKNNIHKVS